MPLTTSANYSPTDVSGTNVSSDSKVTNFTPSTVTVASPFTTDRGENITSSSIHFLNVSASTTSEGTSSDLEQQSAGESQPTQVTRMTTILERGTSVVQQIQIVQTTQPTTDVTQVSIRNDTLLLQTTAKILGIREQTTSQQTTVNTVEWAKLQTLTTISNLSTMNESGSVTLLSTTLNASSQRTLQTPANPTTQTLQTTHSNQFYVVTGKQHTTETTLQQAFDKTFLPEESSVAGITSAAGNTSLQNEKQPPSRYCGCRCSQNIRNNDTTLVYTLLQDLSMDKNNMAMKRRTKMCAPDVRPSSVATGCIAIVVIGTLFGCFILPDILSAFRKIYLKM